MLLQRLQLALPCGSGSARRHFCALLLVVREQLTAHGRRHSAAGARHDGNSGDGGGVWISQSSVAAEDRGGG